MSEPFTLVFDALWTAAESCQSLASLFKLGNRTRLDGDDRNPIKQNVQDSDLPELILSSEGLSAANLHASSCSTDVTHRYAWLVSTGDQRVNTRLNPAGFALLCALCTLREHLMGLEWLGRKFVQSFQLVEVGEGMSDPERNRGIKGWSAVWRVDVRMIFRTADLEAHAASGGSSSA